MMSKKKFAVLIAVFMLFVTNLSAIAYASETETETDVTDESGSEYAKDSSDYEEINYSLNYLGYDSEDKIYCTDYIEVSDESGISTSVAILYTETEMIGEYVKAVDEETSEIRSCFLVENNEEVFEALTGDESGNIEVSVDGESIELTVDHDDAEPEEIEADEFELREYQVDITTPYNDAYYLTTANDVEVMLRITPGAEGYLVKVKNVENDKSYTDNGICWAACGASIVNFFTGAAHTARTMFDKVDGVISGTATGTVANMKAMFDICALKYSSKVGKLTYNIIKAQHKNGSPIMCCIQGMIEKTGDPYGHVVVLCGSFHISTSYGYVYMDPNVHDKLVINYMDYSQISSTSDELYYFGGYGVFFYKCDYTFYNFKKGA